MTVKNQHSWQWLANTFLLIVQINELCQRKLVTVEKWVFASDPKTLIQLQSIRKFFKDYTAMENILQAHDGIKKITL